MVTTKTLVQQNEDYQLPQKFEVNPAYENRNEENKELIDDVHFYVYLTKGTLYIAKSKELALTNIFKSIQVSWLNEIIQDANQINYEFRKEKLQGGLQDIGDFAEGKCFKLESEQGLSYSFCSEDSEEKESWMRELFRVMKKRVRVEKGSEVRLDSEWRMDYKMESKREQESRWVVINPWTSCSVSCGGGYSYLQRICVRGLLNQPCLGDPLLQNTCNTHPCPVSSLPSRVLSPIIKTLSLSQRPQNYQKCILKEGDLYLQLQIANLFETPKMPVRVVINNNTISVFTNNQYHSIFDSYQLNNIFVTPHHSAHDCFYINDFKKDKKQGFCVMSQNLRKGESMEQQMKEWIRVIEEFQFKCNQKQQQKYEDSQYVKDLKQRLQNEYYIQSKNIQNTQKTISDDQVKEIEQKNKIVVKKLIREIKYQNSAIKEQIEKQKQIKQYIEDKLFKEESQKDCQLQENKDKRDEKQLEEIDNIYKYVLDGIDSNAQNKLTELKIIGQKQLERLKKINERKLKIQKNEITLIKQEKAEDVYNQNSKGNESKCIPKEQNDQLRVNYCEDKVKNINVYKYIDCIYGSKIDFCFSCCEIEFGNQQIQLRNNCYLICVDNNSQYSSNSKNSIANNTLTQNCSQKILSFQSSQKILDKILS